MHKVEQLRDLFERMRNLSKAGILSGVLLTLTFKPPMDSIGRGIAQLGILLFLVASFWVWYLAQLGAPSPTSPTSNSQDDSQ